MRLQFLKFISVILNMLLSLSELHGIISYGPLARYVKLRVAHALGMPGTFSPPPRISDPDMHQGTCVTHVPWCISGSLTSGFLWNRWRGKRSRHSRRMRNLQFYVSGKRPIPGTVAILSCQVLLMEINQNGFNDDNIMNISSKIWCTSHR